MVIIPTIRRDQFHKHKFAIIISSSNPGQVSYSLIIRFKLVNRKEFLSKKSPILLDTGFSN